MRRHARAARAFSPAARQPPNSAPLLATPPPRPLLTHHLSFLSPPDPTTSPSPSPADGRAILGGGPGKDGELKKSDAGAGAACPRARSTLLAPRRAAASLSPVLRYTHARGCAWTGTADSEPTSTHSHSPQPLFFPNLGLTAPPVSAVALTADAAPSRPLARSGPSFSWSTQRIHDLEAEIDRIKAAARVRERDRAWGWQTPTTPHPSPSPLSLFSLLHRSS